MCVGQVTYASALIWSQEGFAFPGVPRFFALGGKTCEGDRYDSEEDYVYAYCPTVLLSYNHYVPP